MHLPPVRPLVPLAFLASQVLVAPSLAQVTWTQLPAAAGPTARLGHAMAYDSVRDRIVLFGGADASGRLADTWLFDGAGWTAAAPVSAPVPRAAHSMAYDPGRDRVVLFGGIGIGTGVLGDTWEWNGLDWTQAAPVTQPPARRSHPLVHHPLRGTVVMWGGYSAFDLADMWEWNGVDWSPIATPTSPPPRRASDLAYDPAGLGLLLFSGYLQGADTWFFDGSDWQQKLPAVAPPARFDHSLVTDPARQRVVLFGGQGAVDTWEWDGSGWLRRQPATSPAGRYDTWLVHDLARERVVMFSGSNGLADVWSYGAVRPATYATFGSGCVGSNGLVPRLWTVDRPWLGEPFLLVLDRLPAGGSLTFVVTGLSAAFWGPLPLPFDLGAFGFTGCQLFVEPLVSVPVANAGGAAAWSLNLPNQPVLAGTALFNQAATFDALAPGGVRVTNAGGGIVGGK